MRPLLFRHEKLIISVYHVLEQEMADSNLKTFFRYF